jgi:hypothetical protein
MSTELILSAVTLIGLAALIPCLMVATVVFRAASQGQDQK